MKKVGNSFELSATDLVGYLNCHHLTALDRAVAEGALPKPKVWDPLLQILWERGAAHEWSYVEHLMKAGLSVVRIDGVEVTSGAVADTLTAMRGGVTIIVQAALTDQGWNGRADILAQGWLHSSKTTTKAVKNDERYRTGSSFASKLATDLSSLHSTT